MKKRFFNISEQLSWALLLPLLLLVSLYLSYSLWVSQNFLYSFWYENTQLHSFINQYASENIYKPEFAETTKKERLRVFDELLEKINSGGEGLKDISFFSEDKKILGILLRKPEVDHLKNVSKLIENFKYVAWSAIPFLFYTLFALFLKRKRAYPFNSLLKAYLLAIVSSLVIVLLIGPLKVFEYLHSVFFPEGDQWFFYYQESLMVTLMMAPDLFVYFAGLWVSSSILLCGFLFAMVVYLLKLLGAQEE
jgi:uncharacterized membrane protein